MTIAPASNLQKSRSASDFHVSSHRVLAEQRRIPMANAKYDYPDVVVVPATRKKNTLRHAAGVARIAACPLVIICSKDLTPKAALAELTGEALPPWVLAVKLEDQHAITNLNLHTSRFNSVTDQRCDTSDKRNLAILAARHLGWERILFLDDDVTGLGREQLDAMAKLMAQRTSDGMRIEAVGWAFSAANSNSTDDNSVVCHAYRSTGARQDTFIGAGSLMIRCDSDVESRTDSGVPFDVPFFAKIYNEDWLFLLPSLAAGRVVLAGDLSQERFDPFATPRRAANEEFGDILAEGLYTLLHKLDDTSVNDAPLTEILDRGINAYWWENMVERRRRFIHLIQSELRAKRQIRQAVLESLQAASGVVRNSWSELLAEFVQAWKEDSETWRDCLERIDAQERPATAFDQPYIAGVFAGLGLTGAEWLPSPTDPGHPNEDSPEGGALRLPVPN